jgi:LAO/AO transport system kinase
MTTADIQSLAEAVRSGDRRALSRAITLIESTRTDHRQASNSLLELLMPHTGGAIRLGVSGAPGVGKSTFIEAFGNHVIDQGRRVAVLTVDPSSVISGGSILGDKTRMESLARRESAFIRPSPAGAMLGGVSRRSRETLLLCEAAGFDLVVVETVGVGQSETRVADMTDMFLLLLQPGGGDELQGIKRGIMELADLILINKADGHLEALARQSASDFRAALRLLQPRSTHWSVPVKTCSSLEMTGIHAAWEAILGYQEALTESGEWLTRRSDQARSWLWAELEDALISDLRMNPDIRARLPELEAAAAAGELPASTAATRLLQLYLRRSNEAGQSKEKT